MTRPFCQYSRLLTPGRHAPHSRKYPVARGRCGLARRRRLGEGGCRRRACGPGRETRRRHRETARTRRRGRQGEGVDAALSDDAGIAARRLLARGAGGARQGGLRVAAGRSAAAARDDVGQAVRRSRWRCPDVPC